MENNFIDYLTLITNYSAKDILIQYLIALIISLMFMFVVKYLIKKIPITENHGKQFICCSFLISLIYNFLVPFIHLSIFSIQSLNKIMTYIILLFISGILSFISYFILFPLIQKKEYIKKFFTIQAIIIPVFSIVLNALLFVLIILFNTFI